MNSRGPFALIADNPSIVGTGLIALDIVIASACPQQAYLWAGGTCGNVLTILSHLGWNAFPVGRLGNGQMTESVVADLKRWGVQFDFVTLSPEGSTPVVIHRIRPALDGGTSSHSFSLRCPTCRAWLPRYKPVSASTAREVTERIGNPSVFFMDRLSRGALTLAKASAEKGAIVVFEPSGVSNQHLFQEAVGVAHIVKYSHERMGTLSDTWPMTGALLEIETLGSAGLRYRSRIESCRSDDWQGLDAYSVNRVRDAAGAGDWCTAGILHLLGQTGLSGLRQVTLRQLRDALSLGQAMAAWNCLFEGARGGMYSRNRQALETEVESIKAGGRLEVHNGNRPSADVHDVLQSVCRACAARAALEVGTS